MEVSDAKGTTGVSTGVCSNSAPSNRWSALCTRSACGPCPLLLQPPLPPSAACHLNCTSDSAAGVGTLHPQAPCLAAASYKTLLLPPSSPPRAARSRTAPGRPA